MSTRRVRTASGSYPVRVERSLQPALDDVLGDLDAVSQTVLVTDDRVADLLADRVAALTDDPLVVPRGEGSKSAERLSFLWEALRDRGCDRKSVVLALGGGVVGDLAGFAAATYMRGIRVVHLPTTLLAMVDSAVGGKTAINLGAKNMIGAFHAPAGVVADLGALATLPAAEVRCGLGEVWKTGILSGEPLLAQLEQDAARLVALDLDALEPVVTACVDHKAGVVERDEREAGERALLNLGHTLGHALEVLDDGLTHGEAVTVGGLFACRLAEALDLLDPAFTARVRALAEALGLPTKPTRSLDAGALLALVAQDKKAQAGQVRWVLPRGPGRCELHPVANEQVAERLASAWA